MSRIALLIAAAFLAALCPRHAAAAPAGALDPTFGIGGKRTLALQNGGDVWYPRVVRDSAGRNYLITSVVTGNGDYTLQVMRLHHDGALDTSYGEMGTVTHLLAMPFPDIAAAAMQADGRIVLGLAATADAGIKTCRLLRDGSFDTSFGTPSMPGCADFGPTFSHVLAIVMQPDGRIVLTGEKINFQGYVARLEADGSPDESFGDNGVVLLGPNSNTSFNAAALAPNGDIVVAGRIQLDNNRNFLLMRLAGKDGKPVASFGTWGLVAVESTSEAFALKVLPDGGTVAAGYALTDGVYPAVVKLTQTGQPDESFGPGGKRIYDPCAAYPDVDCKSFAMDLAVLSEERLVLAGSVSSATGDSEFLAMRVLANGEGDPDFGNDPFAPGTVNVAFDLGPNGDADDVAFALGLDGERVLLTGYADVATGEMPPSTRSDFALARLDHGIDTKFTVTPKPGSGGTLSPATPQQIGHSDRAEFAIVPAPGFVLNQIEKGPGYCDGGIDGEVFVSVPVTQPCEVHLSFKRLRVFADSYE